jgi:excisionase family DNA binding protein
MTSEPFVTADDIADHLKIERRQVLQMARANSIPAYPIMLGRRRNLWRFRVSEVDEAIASRSPRLVPKVHPGQATIMIGSPCSPKEQSDG